MSETLTSQLKPVRRKKKRDEVFIMWFAEVALVLLLVVIVGWPSVKAHLQAAAILERVAAQPEPRFLRIFTDDTVSTENTQIRTSAGTIRARVYLPVNHPNAQGLIILHGMHHLGIDEPRLIAFSRTMAASGLRVLTPELPDIKDYHVDSDSILAIGESAKWFALETGKPVGLMGLSFAGGMALVAASEPDYASSVKYVFAVGSQEEMSRVVRYYQTGEDVRPDRSEERLRPNEYGSLVLEYEHLGDFVAEPQDLEPIRAVLRAHLYEDRMAEQRAMAALNNKQRAEASQLLDTTLQTTKTALIASEAKHVDEMKAFSPHGKIGSLRVPVFLLHGEGDNVIPAAETLWLARDLPKQTLKAVLVSPILSHVDVDAAHPIGARARWKLVHFVALVMKEAEKS